MSGQKPNLRHPLTPLPGPPSLSPEWTWPSSGHSLGPVWALHYVVVTLPQPFQPSEVF